MKTSFKNDYSSLAHPLILEALYKEAQKGQTYVAYGLDSVAEEANKLIRKYFENDKLDIHYVTGGTQANLLAVSLFLPRPYEAIIATDTGHINVHETGAIEGTGHKILTVKNVNGKITPEGIVRVMEMHVDEHQVKPKLVYISNSTEIGTTYTDEELLKIREVCDKYNLYLYLDGARFAVAQTSSTSLSNKVINKTLDAFTLGGTKNGLLSGEAFIINNDKFKEDFRYLIKNKGAMLAKGFVVALQYKVALETGIFFEMAKHSNEMAALLRKVLKSYHLDVVDCNTNQIFVDLYDDRGEKLVKEFDLEVFYKDEKKTTIRFVTSYLTTEEDVEKVDKYLKELF